MPTHYRNQTQNPGNPDLNKQTRTEIAAKKAGRTEEHHSGYPC
jgi:hypothetical protein